MESLTQWTCVWAHYGSWWWTGKSGVLQSMGSQTTRYDWWLDWAAPWSPFHTIESSLCVFLERICNKKEINETYMYWHYISQAHRIGFEWYNYIVFIFLWGFPGGDGGEEPNCQYRRCRDAGSTPLVQEVPLRRAWQPTPAFLPRESHGRGAWWAADHGVAKGWKDWSDSTGSHTVFLCLGDKAKNERVQLSTELLGLYIKMVVKC